MVANAAVVSLSPTSLLFSNQIVTGAGSAQTVTLTNKGNIPLTIDSVNISPTDYTETNTCGSLRGGGRELHFQRELRSYHYRSTRRIDDHCQQRQREPSRRALVRYRLEFRV